MQLKAAYSVPELAEMSGLQVDRVRRMLVSNGVKTERNGRVIVVYLSQIKRAMPDLWESILDRLALTQAA